MKSIIHFLSVVLFLFLCQTHPTLGQTNQRKQYVRVSPGVELYYVEAGSGTPIIFIPGSFGTTNFFQKQIAYFSKNYRAITYDPRGQGQSSKTLENNNYLQHGADLKTFMDSLKLKDVILVAHSWGSLAVYAYLRTCGIDNIKAIVFVDASPKVIVEQDGEWGQVKSFNDMRIFYNGMGYDRLNATKAFIEPMFTKPLTATETNWFVEEMLKTPTHVALLLDYDGTMADFTKEARMIDEKIPVLHVLSDKLGWTEEGKDWLKKNAPHAKVTAFGLHFMLWEFPDRFNTAVNTFLAED
ncbi:alpha/beta fold hydrolase [Pontibacter toksunensis]|uniref:Alpha/beta fold hydrolase n=1 Tax=Pontibacter toksunensis TaxID=1332631 RepID=A0ABW6C319_9BACT